MSVLGWQIAASIRALPVFGDIVCDLRLWMGRPHKRPRYLPWVWVMDDPVLLHTLWVLPHTTLVRQDATKLKGILSFWAMIMKWQGRLCFFRKGD